MSPSPLQSYASQIQSEIQNLSMSEFGCLDINIQEQRKQSILNIIQKNCKDLSETDQLRIQDEFFGLGPLENLINDKDATEIIINQSNSVWFEKQGKLQQSSDSFLLSNTFQQIIQKICHECGQQLTVDHPIIDSIFRGFRLNIVGDAITRNQPVVSFRRHPEMPWTFAKLIEKNWCTERQLSILKKIIIEHGNFLIVGPTGSSKTTTVNACLQEIQTNERVVIIEDSSEIKLPNAISTKLLTREDPNQVLKNIDQAQLVKQSLRMRPDRIVMGEVRGSEAKDFLMALATGHGGSFGTIHASDPKQALIRLEMLIQLGAPQWSISAIRQLIFLSLKYLIIVGKDADGTRKLQGIYQIASLEDFGFLIEKLDS